MKKIIFLSLILFVFSTFASNVFAEETTMTYTHPTYKNPDGSPKSWTFTVDDDGEVTEGAMKGCSSLPAKLNEFSKCIMCPFYLTLFNAANKMTFMSFTRLADALKTVMLVGFAILIALRTISQVSSMSDVSTPDFVEDILKQALKVFIAFTFLTMWKEVYYWIVDPILIAGLEWGGAMLFNTDLSAINPSATADVGLISSKVYEKIDVFTQGLQRELAFMQAIGSSLICISWEEAGGYIFPDGAMLLSGIVVYAMSVTVSLAFGFYLIDAMVQLGLVGMLMPFALASWPFKATQKWMTACWNMFLNTFFNFAFMGLVISIVVQVMAGAITNGEAGYDQLISLFQGDNIKDLQRMFEIGVGGFLVLVCCSMFAKKFVKESSGLAGSFSNGAINGMGAQLGGMAASAVTNPIRRTVGKQVNKAKKAIKKKAGKTAGKIGRRIKGGINSTKKAMGMKGGGGDNSAAEEAPEDTSKEDSGGEK